MKKILPFAMLFCLGATTPQPKVEVATGDWSQLPALKHVGYDHLNSVVMMKFYEISRRHRCHLPGQAGMRLNMSLSFAVQYDRNGQLNRVLLPDLNCREAESWLGGTLVQSLNGGDYQPSGENPDGWYRGELSFSYEG